MGRHDALSSYRPDRPTVKMGTRTEVGPVNWIGSGLFHWEIDPYEISTRGAFCSDMEMALGRLDPDEQHFPFDMFAGGGGTSTWERLV